MLSRIEFFITETLTSLRRHPAMAFAASACIAGALVVAGLVGLVMLNVQFATSSTMARMRFMVFFHQEVSRQEAWAAYKQILKLPHVDNADFIPKEKNPTWLEWQKKNPDDAALLGRNPMPDSVSIQADDLNNIPGLRETLTGWDTVGKVKVAEKITSRLLSFRDVVSRAGIIISLILAIVSLVIIHHTIELTLYARRREVFIMSLVGATPSTVAVPFLLEGIVYGLIGAGVALGLLGVGYRFAVSALLKNYDIALLRDALVLNHGVYLILAAGAALGLIGSVISVLKYLRSPRSRLTNA
jgi:cell division transport system permease protein